MPLEYSYKVEVQRLKATEAGLLLDLAKSPTNERAKKELAKVRLTLKFFEERIKDGKDPGVRIL